MVFEWEKQILAYCIRVSRGAVRKGMVKMSVFSEDDVEASGGITIVHLIDIISYITRLHTNLKDSIRRRGFRCEIEVGKKVSELMKQSGYQLNLLNKDFTVTNHDGYGNEVKFYFSYEPSSSPEIVFEDIEVVELNQDIDTNIILSQNDVDLESMIQQKFIEEFDFIDDDDFKIDDKEQEDITNVNNEYKKTDNKI